MTQTLKDFDLLDAHIGIFHYRNLRHIDWALMAVVFVLAATGVVVQYSAGHSTSVTANYYIKQAVFFVFGVGVALFVMCLDPQFLVSVAPAMYGGALLLLGAVLLFGTEVRGGQRWLPLGPFRLQPSEQTKLVLVYMLAWYLTTIKDRIRKLPYFLLTFAIAGIPAALILRQPNLGTAVVLIPVTVVMVYVAGCKWWHLALLILAGLIAAPTAYSQLEDYQKKRLTAFQKPEEDIEGPGWQTWQSKISVGSGGLSGKGFCKSTQTMLNYLPEHHTDFIFSLLAEEHGFVGAAVVIGIFAVFLLRGLRMALVCPDMPGALLATGVVTILAFHIFVNIAITLGLMPVTGIPLPFLSYGGNFYLTTMICVGTLLNVPVRKHLFV